MKETQVRSGASAGTQERSDSSGTPKSRRSGRLSKELPILLFGSDLDGRVFTEETHTVVLSLHGAGIVSKERLIPEQELVLRWKDTGREADVRVVGEIAQQGALHTYGVAFVDQALDFWQMDFPPATDFPERPVTLLLECGGCHGVAELLNGDFEYDICAIHGGLTRFCDYCGMMTVWRHSTDAMPLPRPVTRQTQRTESNQIATIMENAPAREEKTSTQEELEETILPIAEPACKKEVERRSRVRAKVNFFACVRSEAFHEEIVTCIDMARCGVSFRSPHCYEKETLISIAVPFAAEAREAPAIFVRGRIANVRPLGNSGMYRCGVEFLK